MRIAALMAPFYDDMISDRGNDEGGFINYQTANYTGFQEAKWLEGVIPKDGYFKRPLRRRDKDLDILYSDLSELPIIIVWGVIQQRKRVHLQITHWNILPSTQGLYIKDSIGSFNVPLLQPENNTNELLELQDLVAQEAVVSVGILSDVYHLVQNPEHKRPQLQKYNIKDQEKLKLLAQNFRSYYQLLGENEPDIEPFFLLDSAVMFAEINFKEEALNDVKSALESWCYQKNLHSEIFPNGLSPEITENLSNDDLNFLLNLGKTYKLIGDRRKASQLFNFTEKLEEFQQEQLRLQGINSAFLERLELESEALSKKGFEVAFEPVANGYGLVLPIETNLSLVFWIPEQYPDQKPKIAIKNLSGVEPIEFSPNLWQKNYTLVDLVDAVLNARD